MIIRVAKVRYSKPKFKKEAKYGDYYRRNDELSGLGYAGYVEYLKSADWKQIRTAMLEQFPVCRLCPAPASQVHHTDYSPEVLLGLRNRLLVCLCEPCHESVEFTPDRRKRTLPEANVELFRRAVAAGLSSWVNGLHQSHADMLRRRERLKTQREKEAKNKSVPFTELARRRRIEDAKREAKKQERIRQRAAQRPPAR